MINRLLPTVLLLFSSVAYPYTSVCPTGGISVGFFNGVNNTRIAANINLQEIIKLHGTTYPSPGGQSQQVRYELYYNETHGIISNVQETIIQQFRELVQIMYAQLRDPLEAFWESRWLERRGIAAQTGKPDPGHRIPPLYDITPADMNAAIGELHEKSALLANYQDHRNLIDATFARGDKLVLVAHSQGNLFMNQAYDYAAQKGGAKAVKAVHIAPASTRLNGEYTLANTDLIIKAMPSTPQSNLIMPISLDDPSGHALIATYLDPSRPAYAMIRSQLGNALDTVQFPYPNGVFTVTTTWHGYGNVDLHVHEPGGADVHADAPVGQSGTVNTATSRGEGLEHYVTSCNPDQAAPGTYDIGINHVVGTSGLTATIQVATPERGVLLTRKVDVGPVRGRGAAPLPVMSVNLRRSGNNFEVSAN